MTKNRIKAVTLAAAAGGMALAASPAAALDFGSGASSGVPATYLQSAAPVQDVWQHGRDRGKHRGWDNRRYRSSYSDRHYYGEPVYRDTRVWRGRDGRYYCRKEDGTTGLLIGAAVGGLIGNEVAGHRDKTIGTLLGAVGGAFLGRAIDRSDARCR